MQLQNLRKRTQAQTLLLKKGFSLSIKLIALMLLLLLPTITFAKSWYSWTALLLITGISSATAALSLRGQDLLDSDLVERRWKPYYSDGDQEFEAWLSLQLENRLLDARIYLILVSVLTLLSFIATAGVILYESTPILQLATVVLVIVFSEELSGLLTRAWPGPKLTEQTQYALGAAAVLLILVIACAATDSLAALPRFLIIAALTFIVTGLAWWLLEEVSNSEESLPGSKAHISGMIVVLILGGGLFAYLWTNLVITPSRTLYAFLGYLVAYFLLLHVSNFARERLPKDQIHSWLPSVLVGDVWLVPALAAFAYAVLAGRLSVWPLTLAWFVSAVVGIVWNSVENFVMGLLTEIEDSAIVAFMILLRSILSLSAFHLTYQYFIDVSPSFAASVRGTVIFTLAVWLPSTLIGLALLRSASARSLVRSWGLIVYVLAGLLVANVYGPTGESVQRIAMLSLWVFGLLLIAASMLRRFLPRLTKEASEVNPSPPTVSLPLFLLFDPSNEFPLDDEALLTGLTDTQRMRAVRWLEFFKTAAYFILSIDPLFRRFAETERIPPAMYPSLEEMLESWQNLKETWPAGTAELEAKVRYSEFVVRLVEFVDMTADGPSLEVEDDLPKEQYTTMVSYFALCGQFYVFLSSLCTLFLRFFPVSDPDNSGRDIRINRLSQRFLAQSYMIETAFLREVGFNLTEATQSAHEAVRALRKAAEYAVGDMGERYLYLAQLLEVGTWDQIDPSVTAVDFEEITKKAKDKLSSAGSETCYCCEESAEKSLCSYPGCGNPVCSTHSFTCDGCGRALCRDHFSARVEVAKNGHVRDLCADCMEEVKPTCEVCGKAVPRRNTQTCFRCGKLACLECLYRDPNPRLGVWHYICVTCWSALRQDHRDRKATIVDVLRTGTYHQLASRAPLPAWLRRRVWVLPWNVKGLVEVFIPVVAVLASVWLFGHATLVPAVVAALLMEGTTKIQGWLRDLELRTPLTDFNLYWLYAIAFVLGTLAGSEAFCLTLSLWFILQMMLGVAIQLYSRGRQQMVFFSALTKTINFLGDELVFGTTLSLSGIVVFGWIFVYLVTQGLTAVESATIVLNTINLPLYLNLTLLFVSHFAFLFSGRSSPRASRLVSVLSIILFTVATVVIAPTYWRLIANARFHTMPDAAISLQNTLFSALFLSLALVAFLGVTLSLPQFARSVWEGRGSIVRGLLVGASLAVAQMLLFDNSERFASLTLILGPLLEYALANLVQLAQASDA